MVKFAESVTKDNLMRAFAGELYYGMLFFHGML